MSKTSIRQIHARRVWDSRGHPTLEAEITLEGGAQGRAIAPAGASTGSGEALDKRDGGTVFGGHDIEGAREAVDGEIAGRLAGLDACDQAAVDAALIELDGTPDKSRLGGNATIAVSMAAAHAAAAAQELPLWQWLADGRKPEFFPLPEIQIFGGGAHAGRRVDIQDFMVIAVGAQNFAQALDWTAEVYRAAGELMSEEGRLAGVADEGGYWPLFDTNEQALDMLTRAIERAGRKPGDEVAISLDVAASEFGNGGKYLLSRDDLSLDSGGMIELLLGWLERYPIVSIEDPLAEDDPEGLTAFTRAAGKAVQIVGDDFLVTSVERIERAAARDACNAVLIKPNQVGTLTEALAALDAANSAGWGSIISARSGESEDVTIVHLGVGWGIAQLKVGSFARSERMAKWNEGLRIADVLGTDGGRLAPREAFPWARGS